MVTRNILFRRKDSNFVIKIDSVIIITCLLTFIYMILSVAYNGFELIKKNYHEITAGGACGSGFTV
jgi:hypothetical protein